MRKITVAALFAMFMSGQMSAPAFAHTTADATAGATATVGPIVKQKCAVVNDVGAGQVVVKKNAKDPGTVVQLKVGDQVEVCLSVAAAAEANAQLFVEAAADASKRMDCGEGEGTGFDVLISASVAVAPGHHADATATVKVVTNVDGKVQVHEVKLPDQHAYNDPKIVDDDIAPIAAADLGYCKTVALEDPTKKY